MTKKGYVLKITEPWHNFSGKFWKRLCFNFL